MARQTSAKPLAVNRGVKKPAADDTVTLTGKDRFVSWQKSVLIGHWRFALSVACIALAASAVGFDGQLVNFAERQLQSLFFELRGPVATPDGVIILAIDEESLAQGQYYVEDPSRYEALKPIKSWPWQRLAYAQVITRLMEAGAEAVALDMLFPSPSAYGNLDDDAFAAVLDRYGDRIVLAANYNNISLRQGELTQPSLPLKQFRETGVQVGSVTFRRETNGKIHRLGQSFLTDLAEEEAALFGEPFSGEDVPLSFAQATLEAARTPYSSEPQENIFFYGPSGSFRQVPFWYVLDDDPWQNRLDSGGIFAGKIVIVGTTADVHQDFHEAPFSQSLLYPEPMAGVEVLANTIATLQENRSPTQLVQRPIWNALIMFGLGFAVVTVMNLSSKPLPRAIVAGSGLVLWAAVSYGAFVFAGMIVIAGTPMMAIATLGLLDFGASFTAERIQRKRLRKTLARYVTSPLVQEIISQQDDFQDLLAVSQANMIGMLLRDRYRIVEVLGAGGFGETYLAQDTLRPSHPLCVVKQLKIVSNNPKTHHLAQRLFEAEAVVLGQLGEHEQIPRLLAYFEAQQSFYLVQERVDGELLRDLLSRSRPFSPRATVELLRDLLPVISFVHTKGVIHRDIKPSNIIRRQRDGRYVLIDFGAVKTISTQLAGSETAVENPVVEKPGPVTIGIGTQGYMPSEQAAGMPTIRSDLYALGITAIEALTGKPPHVLRRSDNGEIIWSHRLGEISSGLTRIINKMVRYDFNLRHHSAQAVLDELTQLDEQKLSDISVVPDVKLHAETNTTKNQDNQPGVISVDSALEDTQILPLNWANDLPTRADENPIDEDMETEP